VRIYTPPVIGTKMGANLFEWPRNPHTTLSERTSHFHNSRNSTSLTQHCRRYQNVLTYPARRFAARWAYDEPLNKVLVL
jgi:hypothetical protein